MLLGKRSRPPMRRTTSLTELSLDQNMAEGARPSNGELQQPRHHSPAMGMEGMLPMNADNNDRFNAKRQQPQYQNQHQGPWGGYQLSMAPPRNPRRHSADFALEAVRFLKACALCKRPLGPGKETFIYRGEVAFCSLECREQHMIQDDKKARRFLLASRKRDPPQPATKSEASGDGETMVAA